MKEKVNVTGVPETMVQTLYARAKETRKKNAKINDEIAVELVKKLDYDFSKADKDNAMTYGVIARTIVLDQMVKQYLEKNANTVVINIACGLDTRCYRMKGKYLRWYNVDLPETMKIRSQFLTETDSVYQIAKSAKRLPLTSSRSKHQAMGADDAKTARCIRHRPVLVIENRPCGLHFLPSARTIGISSVL